MIQPLLCGYGVDGKVIGKGYNKTCELDLKICYNKFQQYLIRFENVFFINLLSFSSKIYACFWQYPGDFLHFEKEVIIKKMEGN